MKNDSRGWQCSANLPGGQAHLPSWATPPKHSNWISFLKFEQGISLRKFNAFVSQLKRIGNKLAWSHCSPIQKLSQTQVALGRMTPWPEQGVGWLDESRIEMVGERDRGGGGFEWAEIENFWVHIFLTFAINDSFFCITICWFGLGNEDVWFTRRGWQITSSTHLSAVFLEESMR